MSARLIVLAAGAIALALASGLLPAGTPPAKAPQNLMANPSFEGGRDAWQFSKAGGTTANYTIDNQEAADGQASALVTLSTVAEWGVQFGQTIDAGAKGKTYTFAAAAKAVKNPATVRLEIERPADPWDRAAASEPVTLKPGAWTELHVTFKVEKDFKEGWFAYLSCAQAGAAFRADAFRLYEGEYVPYDKAAKVEAATGGEGVRLFDTGVTSAAPLSAEALAARKGWTPVTDKQAVFKGDAVMENGRLALVLRKGATGAELYAAGPKGWTLRATLAPVRDQAKSGALKLGRRSMVDIAASSGSLVGVFVSDTEPIGVPQIYELGAGQVFLKTMGTITDALPDATALRLEAPCRTVILPDFFADDIVVDVADIPVAQADLPSDSFLVHLVGEGEAIVMTVSKDRDADVRMALDGKGAERRFVSSTIPYGGHTTVWVAVLEAAGIWYRRDIARAETGKVADLDWKTPFPAQWRMDWRKADRLVDSWEMVSERANGNYEKPGLFRDPDTVPADRSRWTTVLGTFKYPCWIDRQGQGHIQPLKSDVVRFEGPAIIYPVNRTRGTPLDTFTVADIMRATLGVGPCEYILDVEGQGSSYKGRATCATRDALRAIYSAGQQKAKRAEVEKILDEVQTFVKHIRGRIDIYVDFGHKTLAYLADQKKVDPGLAEYCAQMEPLLKAIDGYVANRKDGIKTPEYFTGLVDQFRKTLLDYEGADAMDKCKKLTEAFVEVGSNQDELAGECRMAVKIVRQRAGLAMATDPRAAKVAEEIRKRTQEVLRNPAGHEGARH
jgi:hypothetical protein